MPVESALLVMPQIQGDYTVGFPPLGIAHLCEYLKTNGIPCTCLDMRVENTEDSLFEFIAGRNVDLIGFSLVTLHYKNAYRLIEKVRTRFDGIIVVGGPHVSTYREKVLDDCTAIDYGVYLDGEETLLELCRGRPDAEIQGLIYREDDIIVSTGARPLIMDLDKLPRPRFDDFDLNRYSSRAIPLLTSRGCPGNCIFCSAKLTSGRKYRRNSAESIVCEIEFWYDRGYHQFWIVDDNFSADRRRLMAICEQLSAKDLDRLRISCKGIRADNVDYPILRQMWGAGFREIQMGVESASDRILNIIKKGETIETIENTIANACKIGFDVSLEFVLGTPGETFQDAEESMKFALKYPVREVCFNNLIPYPHTALYDLVEKEGQFIESHESYLNRVSSIEMVPVFTTPEFSYPERVEALKMGRRTEKQVRQRFLRRKLSKYPVVRTVGPFLFTIDFVYSAFKRSTGLRKHAMSVYDHLSGERKN